jgi:GTP-binding protein HflX
VLAENKLFSTLDTVTRRIRLPDGNPMLLTDTVGFIQKLPTMLIAAFRATLEDLEEADLLLHVIDITHEKAPEQALTVNQTLNSLGVAAKPQLLVLNKIDLVRGADGNAVIPERVTGWNERYPWVAVSAAREWHLDALISKIHAVLQAQSPSNQPRPPAE